jgi:hypothetical protein
MTGICFHRERDWEQDQWSFVFSNFGVSDIWEYGDLSQDDLTIYQPTTNIVTAAELPSDRPLVVLAPAAGKYIQGTESLEDFVHPENAIYMFGGSHVNLNDEEHMGGRVADHYVYISLVQYECYAHGAATVVLWDKRMKQSG